MGVSETDSSLLITTEWMDRQCSQGLTVHLTLCGTPVQSTHKKFPETSKYINTEPLIIRNCDKFVHMLQKTWQRPRRNVACPGDLKDLNTLDLVKKSECSVWGITTLQLTEQQSTQILHNMRQRCYRSCCSLGRYSQFQLKCPYLYDSCKEPALPIDVTLVL